jgi:hypothetical protein
MKIETAAYWSQFPQPVEGIITLPYSEPFAFVPGQLRTVFFKGKFMLFPTGEILSEDFDRPTHISCTYPRLVPPSKNRCYYISTSDKK